MPQPLRRAPKDLAWRTDAAKLRPFLAHWIVRVSNEWAKVQVNMGLVLAAALNTEANVGIHMYLALTGSAAQEAAISAAIEAQLPQSLQTEFADLLRKYRSCARQRNKIIHCMWGVSDKHPKSIINCPPEQLIKSAIDPNSPLENFFQHCMLYDEKDFFNICDEIQALGINLWSFFISVSLFHNPNQLASESDRLELLEPFKAVLSSKPVK